MVYVIERNPDDTLKGSLPAMTEPTPVVVVTQVEADLGCAVEMTMTASIVFPPGKDGLVDTVTAAYSYSVTAVDGNITGTGEVHMTTIANNGKVKVDCKEPLDVTGKFTPADK